MKSDVPIVPGLLFLRGANRDELAVVISVDEILGFTVLRLRHKNKILVFDRAAVESWFVSGNWKLVL